MSKIQFKVSEGYDVYIPYTDGQFTTGNVFRRICTYANEEERIVIVNWSMQSGDWGCVITYVRCDSMLCVHEFRWSRNQSRDAAEQDVNSWFRLITRSK